MLAGVPSGPKAAAAAGHIEAASKAQRAPVSAVDYVVIMDRVTCSCRSCNAGNVWKLTCKNLYSHVAVLALLAGHGTLRVTAATATCNCK